MVDITINGSITFPKYPDEFSKDFNDLLSKYSAHFHGRIQSYEFDEAEIVIDEEMNG